MTRRERLERKLEKREEWAQSRKSKAQSSFRAADRSVEGIPMGQPILVGHHSEKRHRGALNRCHTAMHNGLEHEDMAKHHSEKAAGLSDQLDRCIFSDDDDAIEQLQAKINRLTADQERMKATNKIVRRKPKNECTDDKLTDLQAMGMSEGLARKLFEPDFCGRIGIASYELSNNNAVISNAKKRISQIKYRTAQAQAAEDCGGVLIKKCGTSGYSSAYSAVTFSEKPDYNIIKELKAAGFSWHGGSWTGLTDNIPESVTELAA